MKHKADGLYYFDRGMLERVRTCSMARNDIGKFMGGRRKILVTYDNVERLSRRSVWVSPRQIAFRLSDAHKVNLREADSVFDTYDLMDLLFIRAKREGLIK